LKIVRNTQTKDVTKDDLVNILSAVEIVDYDPDHEGSFGPSPKITVNIVEIDGPRSGARHMNRYFFGLLARQIGESAAPGETIVGRVQTGKKGPHTWYGFGVSKDDADYDAAEAVVANA
jgi:hypothetical protein